MKTVLLISPEYLTSPLGGLEKQTKLLYDNLLFFFNIKILCFDNFQNSDKNIITYNIVGTNYNHQNKANCKILENKIKNINPDYIIIMDNTQYVCFLLLSCINLNIPIVWSITTDPRLLLKRFLYNLELINQIVNSVSIIRLQLPQYQRFIKKSIVIPNLIIEKNISVSENFKKEIVVCANNLDAENKNIFEIVNTFQKIKTDYVLKIYGTTNKNFRVKNIFFCGSKHNIDDIFLNSAFYITASDYEGMSNSVIEALLYNLPVLSKRICLGASSLYNENSGGIVFDETRTLHSAIRFLLDNKQILNKMKHCTKDVINNFQNSKTMQFWVDTLTTIKCAPINDISMVKNYIYTKKIKKLIK